MSSAIKNVLCKSCLILIVGLTFLAASYAHAQQQTVVLRVDGDNGSLPPPQGTADGSDWGTTAFRLLQDALAEAEIQLQDPDVDMVHLWVAATIQINPYRPDRDAANPDGTSDRTATFLLDFNNVTLLGGFFGDETDPDDRDPDDNVTVLSGLLADILECGDPGAGDCLEVNGSAACDDLCGGEDCPFCCQLVCAALPECCDDPWDQDCVDYATDICGVCAVPGSGNCFAVNESPGCEDLCNGQECPGCCALICAMDPLCCLDIGTWDEFCQQAAIEQCIPLAGEFIKAYHVVTADDVDDTVRIDGFTITDGLAIGGGTNGLVGAGMLIVDSDLAVVRITFTENAAPIHGGAMNISGDSDPMVVNTSFLQNSGREAGALHTEDGTAGGTFVNCLFSNNTSVIEGGAINPGGGETLTFINCTMADNSVVNGQGGGAIFTEVGVGPVILINCILWDNEAAGGPVQIIDCCAAVTVTYSDVEGGWPGVGNLDPPLDPLFEDPGNGDYRLDALSPCIDVGDPDETVIPMDEFDVNQDGDTDERTPDLDLNDRLINEAGSCSEGRVDMGAYEAPACCPHDMDNDGTVGATDLLTLLVQWGTDPGGPPDFDCNGVVSSTDLLSLLVNWGPCPCGVSTSGPTLAEELADACLTQEDWDEFVDVMTDPRSSQADKDRYNCWMIHYLFHCNNCSCPHLPECPSPDPFN